jgi:L-alanine-DL-glutamate epimerase-like enolase superfamily enzyme
MSSILARDGVTDVVVKVTTDDGLVGWGESCSGADVRSVEAAIQAMTPLALGRSPWNAEAIRDDVYRYGHWSFRAPTGNFAWAGIEMALWDIRGKAAEQPLYRLFGGLRRPEVSYFYYLAVGNPEDVASQCARGLELGFDVFYLKVGTDFSHELAMVAAAREALGTTPRLRLDANGSWTLPQARRCLDLLEPYDIDFVEQPVREHPIAQLAELRGRGIAIAANEGLWTEADALDRIIARAADVFCFSPYWVGSLAGFHRLAHLVNLLGLEVCKHTHGELGITAAACHHLLLTLPAVVDGNQHTAHMVLHDVIRDPLPIATGPSWGIPDAPGLGVEIDDEALAEGSARYRAEGQYLPYQLEQIGRQERNALPERPF